MPRDVASFALEMPAPDDSEAACNTVQRSTTDAADLVDDTRSRRKTPEQTCHTSVMIFHACHQLQNSKGQEEATGTVMKAFAVCLPNDGSNRFMLHDLFVCMIFIRAWQSSATNYIYYVVTQSRNQKHSSVCCVIYLLTLVCGHRAPLTHAVTSSISIVCST